MTEQQKLDAIAQKMRAAKLSSELQNSFLRAVSLAEGGDDGTIPETEIEPVASLPDIETLNDYSDSGRQALGETVIIKLNGGLGTSMGLEKAKSLLPVRDGLSFLELIARQVIDLRTRYQSPLPLIFMNSFPYQNAPAGNAVIGAPTKFFNRNRVMDRMPRNSARPEHRIKNVINCRKKAKYGRFYLCAALQHRR